MSKKQEVIDKIARLVSEEFNGDYKAAFNHYDESKDDKISSEELTRLLVDAEIGSRLTRWAYIREIVDELDKDEDGLITWGEFVDALG
jgi:Ca2+-binding EF-hand superfamily protein